MCEDLLPILSPVNTPANNFDFMTQNIFHENKGNS